MVPLNNGFKSRGDKVSEEKPQKGTRGKTTPPRMKRKRYSKPHLITYGNVEKFTQSAGTRIGDHGPRRRG